jgi:CRISPR-associated protein (TIGR03984 family)
MSHDPMKHNPHQLQHGAIKNKTLDQVLAAVAGPLEGASVLVYAPTRCVVARLDGGQFKLRAGEVVDAAEPFEVRIFNEQIELGWLQESGGRGRAAWLGDDAQVKRLCEALGGDAAHSLYAFTCEQRYLLWGKRNGEADAEDGWTQLTSGRIGALEIPHKAGGTHLQLETLEYFRHDSFGNAVLIDERLKGFVAYAGGTEEMQP